MVDHGDISRDDTHKGPCGCLYCRDCIVLYLTNSVTISPAGPQLPTQSVDLAMDLNVVQERQADHKLSVLQIPKHLNVCFKKPMGCPYAEVGCLGKTLPIDRLTEHLQRDILMHNKLLVEWIRKTRQSGCEQTGRGAGTELEELCQTITDILSKKQVIIEGLVNELSHLKWKIGDISQQTASLRSTNEENILDISQLKENNEARMSELQQYFESQIQQCQQDMSSQRESLRSREAEVSNLRRKIATIEKLFSRTNSLNKCIREKIVKVASFRWCVEEFKEMRNDGEEMIYSECFYSFDKEFKMRLWLYPNGSGDALGNDVSFQLLVWNNSDHPVFPMKADVTVAIKNILKPQISQSITQLCWFDKPGLFNYSISEPFHFNYCHLNSAGVLMYDLIAVECIILVYKLPMKNVPPFW